MLELYIIAFLILFTNQKHKNMSLTSFVCSLSNHKAKASRRSLVQRHGQEEVKASMVMVPKALIHQICLPITSIHHFDQSKSKGLRFVPQRNPNSSVHHNALLLEQPQPTIKYKQRKVFYFLFHSSFHAYIFLCECPQSSIHQDLGFGLEKLISQFI